MPTWNAQWLKAKECTSANGSKPPMPLKMFVLCAGALGTKPLNFLLTIVAARIPRYFCLAWLGTQFGHDTMPWIKSHVWHLVAVGLLLALTMGLMARWINNPTRGMQAPG
jgi:uncharacterized membrane protein YdjX (TVP38/TMEM64 family)